MKRDIRKMAVAAAAAVLLISISGAALAFFHRPDTGTVQVTGDVAISVTDRAQAEGEPQSVLLPETPAASAPVVQNIGDNPCYVRVKLDIPQVEGIPLLRVGLTQNGRFDELYTAEANGSAREYWQSDGQYLYYRNAKTGNLLRPGKETPPIYEAVALNTSLPDQQLMLADGDTQAVIVYAEAAEADVPEETAWQRVPAQGE